jgi:hypothetical protein
MPVSGTTVGAVADDVVPDDKNWTWVLERRCDDCGFDAESFDVRRTADALRDLGSRWAAVLARPDARQRPRPGVWSPLEYGCHVRDVFRLFDRRVASMLEVDDPEFENWDQDAAAVGDDYGSQDPRAVADETFSAAGAVARRFEAVTIDQWARRGVRSDGSAFTVDSIARYMLHDPIHHLWDVGAEMPAY